MAPNGQPSGSACLNEEHGKEPDDDRNSEQDCDSAEDENCGVIKDAVIVLHGWRRVVMGVSYMHDNCIR